METLGVSTVRRYCPPPGHVAWPAVGLGDMISLKKLDKEFGLSVNLYRLG